jgi:hypothetical protein
MRGDEGKRDELRELGRAHITLEVDPLVRQAQHVVVQVVVVRVNERGQQQPVDQQLAAGRRADPDLRRVQAVLAHVGQIEAQDVDVGDVRSNVGQEQRHRHHGLHGQRFQLLVNLQQQ